MLYMLSQKKIKNFKFQTKRCNVKRHETKLFSGKSILKREKNGMWKKSFSYAYYKIFNTPTVEVHSKANPIV